MLTNEQCRAFRPIGSRLLVQRYPLSEQSRGGVIVLGRDFPTLGRVIRVGNSPTMGQSNGVNNEITIGDEVQWAIRPDFDQRCVIGPDWLCLDADDINVRIDQRGVARAVGNRVLLTQQDAQYPTLLEHVSPIITTQFTLTRWALGNVQSAGLIARKLIDLHSDVIYNPSFRSELTLNHRQYFVVRDEDCIATVEN